MKKETTRIIWVLAILLVLYCMMAFLIPFVKTGTFWVSFVFTLIAFVVSGVAIYIAFIKNPDAKSRFYGFPIARIGVIYGLVQLVVGFGFMALSPWAPAWLAVLVYGVGLGVAVIGLISAETVVEQIHEQDVKLRAAVSCMRVLQSQLNQMEGLAENQDVKACVKKLSDEFRYSDPVSSEAVAEVEKTLLSAVDDLQQAVLENEPETVRVLCRNISATLAERNRICKLNKG